MAKIEIYKRSQGKYTRLCTFFAAWGGGAIGAVLLGEFLYELTGSRILQYGIPVAVIVSLAAVMFWVVNRPKTADFLIATEGEMKKVSWSTRREVVGSTKVVIVTTVIMALLLLVVDVVFVYLFGPKCLKIMG